ncbi:Putative aminoacrylate peracid reductase RutC [Pseudomonas fluorescens]|uniref:Aminoacrylate peracid reductase RutC n=1 Tax=Pseudomonas fluorescens TaxID=294 RepID=A0A5E7SFK4_PSEFL|nr:RidA family protein [Pseudomonas fluorescens]VVP85561.1 Putative aminoacrylate peracid reductase RutC [Pseudomonas fluorescens]
MRISQWAAGLLALVGAHCAHASPQFLNSGAVLKGESPFSEAVKINGTLFLSGQVGIETKTQKLAPGGIEAESRQAMDNIDTILRSNGYAMADVVKCTVFLVDMSEWTAFNDIYKSRFETGKYPARSALGVNALALSARVEVECIAAK